MLWWIYAARHRQGANPHRACRHDGRGRHHGHQCSGWSRPTYLLQDQIQWHDMHDSTKMDGYLFCAFVGFVRYEASDRVNAKVNDVLKLEGATYKLFESK